MNNLLKLLFLCSIVAMYSCDKLENDVVPDDQEPIQLQENVFSMPNTPLIFDLKKSLVMAGDGRLRTSVQPQKGSLSLLESGFIRYSPKAEFTSGSDFFVMEALGASGKIIDTDTINITMVSDTTEIPCFNGALTDNVRTIRDLPVTFNVIKNDGYCREETNGAIVEIIAPPAHGEVSLVDLFTYSYAPDPDFVGKDSLIYSLELVDREGESHFSTAFVNFHVESQGDTCQITLNDDRFQFETLQSNGYVLHVSANDKLCSNNSLEYFIQKQPSSGSATIYSHPDSVVLLIEYIPDMHSDIFTDSLTYVVQDANGNEFRANVVVEVDAAPCTFQLVDDHYEVIADTLNNGSILFGVLWNDEICEWAGLEYGISADNSSSGTVSFEGDRLKYTVPAEAVESDTVSYQVCQSTECKTAEVVIDLYW